MNPYYSADGIDLYLGDCREVTAWLDVDGPLITDPPYGIGWSRGQIKKAHNGAANEGIKNDHDTSVRDEALRMWLAGPALVFGSLDAPYPKDWKRMLVFGKPPHAGLIGSRMPWFRNWEPIFVLGTWPDQTPQHSAIITTRHKAASGYSGYATIAGHPHAKPLDVMQELISVCPDGTIADPFAGSGSTLVAAKLQGRKAIGVEIEERYAEICARRLDQGVLEFPV